MKRNRFSEEQIIGILKEHEAGCSGRRLVPQARREQLNALVGGHPRLLPDKMQDFHVRQIDQSRYLGGL